ncbi:unnamed protein product [Cuscuta epithymum]|uniref:PLAC8 family protein n=1 Tax=Cuscuta epithymum TaxID=186058 RepID=A0AAV0EHW6_9ASTE|nr:unnamed protein product [Cuscuta epithymum]
MANDQYMHKMQARQSYRNHWHTDLMNATLADPLYCCFSVCCAPCASYLLRKRALYNDMSRYTCCGGYMPCSGRCGESHCPELCLCTEVFCCFANSVASTRFILQDEFNIQTTQCDNCIIGFMFCLQQLACICSCIACIVGSEELNNLSQMLNCLSDTVYCSVCSCMQTQHKVEMDKRDGKFGRPQAPLAVPPVQHMSRIDQPLPPPAGSGQPPPAYPPQQQGYVYPPQPGQGYSYQQPGHGYGYPPPPPGQGYAYTSTPPTQGYPLPNYPPPAM